MKMMTKVPLKSNGARKDEPLPSREQSIAHALKMGFEKKDEIEVKIAELQKSIELLQREKNEIARTIHGRVGSGPFRWRGQCFQVVRRRGMDDTNPEEGASYVFRGEGIRQPTIVG